ncbi:MAG: hypothetical protein ACFB3T_10260 [Geminicoccaceae bacterium]
MAFQLDNLSALTYANGFTFWHYCTEDPISAVTASGYLDAADGFLRAGDLVVAHRRSETSPEHALLVVTAAATPIQTQALAGPVLPPG